MYNLEFAQALMRQLYDARNTRFGVDAVTVFNGIQDTDNDFRDTITNLSTREMIEPINEMMTANERRFIITTGGARFLERNGFVVTHDANMTPVDDAGNLIADEGSR